jgi:hypothetical protein
VPTPFSEPRGLRYRSAHPTKIKQKEAERRQTRVSLLHLAAKRAPCAGRARLSAFHGGSAQGTHASPGAISDQASRSQHHDGGDLPPASAPVTASTSHTGHSAGGHDVRNRPGAAATNPPPAGTASRSPPAIVTGRRPCTWSERPALLFLARAESSRIVVVVDLFDSANLLLRSFYGNATALFPRVPSKTMIRKSQ